MPSVVDHPQQLLVIEVGDIAPVMRQPFQPHRCGVGILMREIAGNFEARGIVMRQQRFDKIGDGVLTAESEDT